MEGLENGNGEAFSRQQVGVDQAGRPGTDDGNRRFFSLLPGIGEAGKAGGDAFRINHLLALRQIPFDLADFNRLLGMRANTLALQFLRADAAGNVGQRIAVLDQLHRFAEAAGTEQVKHFRDVDLDRAAALGLELARHVQANFARPLLALLVTQGFEPDEHLDVAGGKTDVHVAEVTLVDQPEVLRPLFWITDVGRNVVVRRPVFRQTLEHRVATRQVQVNRTDELAFEAQRHGPDKAHQHLAGVVVAQHQIPERGDERGTEFRLLELPDDGIGAVGDEHVAEGVGLLQQAATQEFHLVMEVLDRRSLLQGFEL